MDRLRTYEIDFKGFESSVAERHYTADDAFFEAVQGNEIQHGKVEVDLTVRETAGAFRLDFTFEGYVEVACDRCLEPMQLPINAEEHLKVKLGAEADDDGETITILEDDGKLNIAWNVYELIALQIPIRHVHPDGECTGTVPEMVELADETAFDADDSEEENATGGSEGSTGKGGEIDPRWSKLKEILDNN